MHIHNSENSDTADRKWVRREKLTEALTHARGHASEHGVQVSVAANGELTELKIPENAMSMGGHQLAGIISRLTAHAHQQVRSAALLALKELQNGTEATHAAPRHGRSGYDDHGQLPPILFSPVESKPDAGSTSRPPPERRH
ncbi:hypothetical protein [Rhodococcus sp. ARC_M6]|uniref:hypothetical protein n=1 Tax=Rhodococcus sp. ARC_M6 TaxID=2928852 RepID=UPI001FB3B104|nr:hypothetical protein [Rhodococcus sp. ARC_M6]MCJ0906387.1 hypothetical protein [Rhodococcus sp. ARC_M6]